MRCAARPTSVEWRDLVVPSARVGHKIAPLDAVTAAPQQVGSSADRSVCTRWAEAEGFEPSMGLKPQTALAVRRHRPD